MYCQFCGAQLSDAARYCWKCGKEQLSVQSVSKDDLMIRAHSILLTLPQLQAILDNWGKSYKYIPDEAYTEIDQMFKPMLHDMLHPVIELYYRHNLDRKFDVQKLSLQAGAVLHMWAFACLGVGIELNNGSIKDELVPYYLLILSRSYLNYMNDLMKPLFERRFISQEKINSIISEAAHIMNEKAVQIANAGWLHGSSVAMAMPEGQSAFASDLKRLLN